MKTYSYKMVRIIYNYFNENKLVVSYFSELQNSMKKLTYIFMFLSFVSFSQEKDKALIQSNDLIFEAN